jgi:hypothetical protein
MLENLTPPKRVQQCRVNVVLESLESKDREILSNALADLDNWGALTLAKALRDRGVDLKQEVIRRHRMKMCACSRISNQQ